jgi:hypothetical protein
MLRKCVWVPVVAVLALLPAVANAQFQQGDWELTLSGQGVSDEDFDNTNVAVAGSLGYFFTDQIEVSFRQGINWLDIDGGGSDFAGRSAFAADFHFDLDRWQPFVGINAGYNYGDNVDDNWFGGPEGGLKYFVNNTTFIFGQVSYQFIFESSDQDDFWVYLLGIGFRW